MNDAEREHWDHEMGAATEQQNVYAMSSLDRKPDDSAKIDELVNKGRFVTIIEGSEYCRHTDALLPGSRRMYCGDYATRQEADAALAIEVGDDPDPDLYYQVLPREISTNNYVPCTDSDIPF